MPGLVRSLRPPTVCVFESQSGSTNSAATHFRQTKIKNLGVPALGDENVGGLDVAVNDPLAMSRVERIRDLDCQRKQQFQVQRPTGNAVLQRHAIEKFHGDEGWPLSSPMSWMVQMFGWFERRGGLRLALEAAERLLIPGHVIGKELQSDETAEASVFGLVNDAHPAAAQLLDDAVMRNGLADH